MAFLRKKTGDGFTLGVYYSLFQKCIRRNLPDKALYYGLGIAKFGTLNALKKRIIQCILEDLSNWHFALAAFEMNTLEEYQRAILGACSAPKCHMSAYLQRLALEENRGKLAGAISGEVAGLLRKKFALDSLAELSRLDIGERYPELRAYLEGNLPEGITKGSGRKLFTLMGRGRLVWVCCELSRGDTGASYLPELPASDAIAPKPFEKIPEWALDKHVSSNFGATKGYAFFFENGLVFDHLLLGSLEEDIKRECLKIYLAEEAKSGTQAKTKHTIERLREGAEESNTKSSEEIMLEEKGYLEPLQAQLVCRRGAPKVFFAKEPNTMKRVVLKGPLNTKLTLGILESERLKKQLGVPHCNYRSTNIDDKVWMVFDDMRGGDADDSFEIRSSKLETSRRIHSGQKCICSFDWGDPEAPHFEPLLRAYLFKVLIGANDFAKRNFLEKDGVVYPIDDHAVDRGEVAQVKPPKLTKAELEAWDTRMRNHREVALGILADWKAKLGGDSIHKKRLESMENYFRNLAKDRGQL